jgi:hypothetical protein
MGQGIVREPHRVSFALSSRLDDALGEEFTRGGSPIIGSEDVARCPQHLPCGIERRRLNVRRFGVEEIITPEQPDDRHGDAPC